MSDLQITALLFCGLYFIFVIIVGYFAGRKIKIDDFIIGNRDVGILGTASSIGAGLRDVGFVWFWITFSYLNGYALAWLFVFTGIGVFIFMPFAKKLRAVAKEKKYVSPVELINDRIGPLCEGAVSFSSIISVLILASAQFMVLGMLFSTIFKIDPYVTAMILFVVTSTYLWNGGYKSIISTDIIQSGFIIIMLTLPFMMPNVELSTFMQFDTVASLGVWDTFFLCAPLIFYAFTNNDFFQRVFSARDDRTVTWALPLSIVMIAVLSIGLIFLGMALRSVDPDMEPEKALFALFEGDSVSPIILSLMLVVFVAMGMSTLDSNAYNVTSVILRNFKKRKNIKSIYFSF